jgi:uncharacterized membrane protein
MQTLHLLFRFTSTDAASSHARSMEAALAPSPWPAPAPRPRAAGWRFGHERADGAMQWKLARNCSLTPRQMLASYLALCAVALSIGTAFAVSGAPIVLGFAGLELAVVGIALLVFARHAGDRETLTLVGRSLQVERCNGSRVERAEFAVEWLTVEPAAGQNSLVQLAGQGRTMRIGRWLRPELRADFARELRQVLRLSR